MPAVCSGYRLKIEATGARQTDAASFALRLVGIMLQSAHTQGHSCGGDLGNASGNWEKVDEVKTTVRDVPDLEAKTN